MEHYNSTAPPAGTSGTDQAFVLGGSTPLSVGRLLTPTDMASGINYEVQVAQRSGATAVPGSGRIGQWSDVDRTVIG